MPPLYIVHKVSEPKKTVNAAILPFNKKKQHQTMVTLRQYSAIFLFQGELGIVLSIRIAKRNIIVGGRKRVKPKINRNIKFTIIGKNFKMEPDSLNRLKTPNVIRGMVSQKNGVFVGKNPVIALEIPFNRKAIRI